MPIFNYSMHPGELGYGYITFNAEDYDQVEEILNNFPNLDFRIFTCNAEIYDISAKDFEDLKSSFIRLFNGG